MATTNLSYIKYKITCMWHYSVYITRCLCYPCMVVPKQSPISCMTLSTPPFYREERLFLSCHQCVSDNQEIYEVFQFILNVSLQINCFFAFKKNCYLLNCLPLKFYFKVNIGHNCNLVPNLVTKTIHFLFYQKIDKLSAKQRKDSTNVRFLKNLFKLAKLSVLGTKIKQNWRINRLIFFGRKSSKPISLESIVLFLNFFLSN
jgi:hypothetical protein